MIKTQNSIIKDHEKLLFNKEKLLKNSKEEADKYKKATGVSILTILLILL